MRSLSVIVAGYRQKQALHLKALVWCRSQRAPQVQQQVPA